LIFRQRLGKNPDEYPDAKSQPHVQVALRMKQKGGSARNGDVIPYVFCLSEGEESAKTAQADRAKHPDEVRKDLGLMVGEMHEYPLLEIVTKLILRL
jgi:DNA polymerase alpha subunit A